MLEELNKSFHLVILITGGLLEEACEEARAELHNTYNTIELDCGRADNTLEGMGAIAGRLYRQVLDHFTRLRPDCVILWADRYELLPVASASAYLQIPICHIQGGEVSGNIDDKVRNAISMLSDIHMVSHSHAGKRLSDFGLNNIHVTGCPSLDIIRINDLKSDFVESYVVCMFHPHTKELDFCKENTLELVTKLTQFCNKKKLKILWFGPNNDPGHESVKEALKCMEVIDNINGNEYLETIARARFIIGNTSSCIREASYLGLPAVVVGDRQKNRVHAESTIFSDFNTLDNAMEMVYNMVPYRSSLFGDGMASQKITKILGEYLNGKEH